MIVITCAMYAIALTFKIGTAGSRRLGGTTVTVLYVLCVLCVVVVCERRLVLGCPLLAYNILYYGIILGVGISIVVPY
jgi:hypothetical protein